MDQILLFGDSITEFAEQTPHGYSTVLRAGEPLPAKCQNWYSLRSTAIIVIIVLPVLASLLIMSFCHLISIKLQTHLLNNHQAYTRRLDVVNRGLSGYNTDMAVRVLDKVVPGNTDDKIRLLVIFFGANDSCFYTERNNQSVPLPEFRSNLIKIIRTITDNKSPRILLVTNPPIDERTQEIGDILRGLALRRTAENSKAYADAVRGVGKDMGIVVCDLWEAIMLRAGWKPNDELLPGCKLLPPNEVLDEVLSDGKSRPHESSRSIGLY